MNKYKLIVVGADESLTKEYANVVKNLSDAEILAEKLRKEYVENYPDVYVACYPYDDNIQYPYNDYLCWQKDIFGDIYWKMMRVSDHGTRLYMDLPTDYEQEIIEEKKNEKEQLLSDLSEDELKSLRKEICVGSDYLSDYENSFNVDSNLVSNFCDFYIRELEEEMDEQGVKIENGCEWMDYDTPEKFAQVCLDYWEI